jgi:hypothetical protein
VKPKKNEGSENACPVRNPEIIVASRNGIKKTTSGGRVWWVERKNEREMKEIMRSLGKYARKKKL